MEQAFLTALNARVDQQIAFANEGFDIIVNEVKEGLATGAPPESVFAKVTVQLAFSINCFSGPQFYVVQHLVAGAFRVAQSGA